MSAYVWLVWSDEQGRSYSSYLQAVCADEGTAIKTADKAVKRTETANPGRYKIRIERKAIKKGAPK